MATSVCKTRRPSQSAACRSASPRPQQGSQHAPHQFARHLARRALGHALDHAVALAAARTGRTEVEPNSPSLMPCISPPSSAGAAGAPFLPAGARAPSVAGASAAARAVSTS
ncbi:hypothetical protein L560_1347 [Bordetella pertussis STO1-CHOC-0018]|nr:hypothetical protein L560_1347 [Bordetella pertussis STO1-CHOC-0018]